MKKILDIRITRNRQARTIRLNQTHYLKKIIDRLYISKENKHKKTEISVNDYDALRSAKLYDERVDQKKYQ